MNYSKIEKKLVRKFGDYDLIDADSHIYKFRQEYKSIPFGIYYIDAGSSPLRKGFNIDDYQKEFIIKDYYSNPGSLQWNYYILFILDKTEYIKPEITKLKRDIESNREYSRKYLIAENNLDDWLSRPLSPIESGKEVGLENISVRWAEKLNDVGLKEINETTGIDRLVNEFIENPPDKKPSAKVITKKSTREMELGNLVEMHIKNYRQRILAGKYVVKPVTLLYGPNGVGKTSYLEAIELSLCGRTLRSGNNREPEASIQLKFENELTTSYPTQDNLPFRTRDNLWYNNPYTKGNNLSKSFSRYNFFDTDAAHKLSSDKSSKKDINDAFIKLALGSEVIFLEKRISDCLQLFSRKKKNFSIQMDKETKTINEEKALLSSLKEILQKPNSLFNSVVALYKKVNWKGAIPKQPSDSIDASFLQVRNTLEAVESIQDTLAWVKKPKFSSIQNENNRLSLSITSIEKKNQRLAELYTQLSNISEERENIGNQLELLNKAEPYYSEPNIEKLAGLAQKIQLSQQNKLITEENVKIASKINFEKLDSLNETFIEYETRLKSSKHSLNKKVRKNEIELENLRVQFGQIKTIVAEIKSLGLSLIEADPRTLDCPLCNTKFKKGELIEKINHIELNHNDESSLLEPLSRKLKEHSLVLKNIMVQLSYLELITKVGLDYWNIDKFENLPMTIIINKLENLPELLQESSELLAEYSNLHNYFAKRHLEESTLEDLTGIVSLEFPGIELSYKERNNLNSQKLSCIRKIEKLDTSVLGLKKEIKQIEHEILSAAKKEYQSDGDLETYEFQLNDRHEQSILAAGFLDIILEYVEVDLEDTIQKLAKGLMRLIEKLESYEAIQIERKSTTAMIEWSKKKIDQSEKERKDTAMKQERCNTALKSLENILTRDSKENAENNFIKNHQTSITQMFIKMHTPNEFDDMKFSHDNSSNEILLRRRLTGKWYPINKISSGQRSALALSIFLSMNLSATKAPPIILFDDPVSHTDDMNIISFLDFLRDLVLEHKKQIVFATANQRIANLFTMKFDFLGDDFLRYDLSSSK